VYLFFLAIRNYFFILYIQTIIFGFAIFSSVVLEVFGIKSTHSPLPIPPCHIVRKEAWPVNPTVQSFETTYFCVPVEESKKKYSSEKVVKVVGILFQDKSYLINHNGIYRIRTPWTVILMTEDGSFWSTETRNFEKTSYVLTCL